MWGPQDSGRSGAALDRTKRLEKERLERILDSKKRQIGVDKAALDEGVRLRLERERLEREANEQIASDLKKCATIVSQAERDDMYRRRMIARQHDMANASRNPAATREADLQLPPSADHVIRRDPAFGEVDPTLGVSSGQFFDGEDSVYKQRMASQKHQTEQWHRQHMASAALVAAQAKAEAEAEARDAATVHELMEAGARRDREARRQAQADTAALNLQLKANREEKERREREEEERQNQIHWSTNARMVDETLSVPMSEQLPGRFIPYAFKGLSKEQVTEGYAGLKAQGEERRERERQEREAERERERQQLRDDKELVRRANAHEREVRRQRMGVLGAQDQEKRATTASELQREREDQPIKDDFFAYFNKTSRVTKRTPASAVVRRVRHLLATGCLNIEAQAVGGAIHTLTRAVSILEGHHTGALTISQHSDSVPCVTDTVPRRVKRVKRVIGVKGVDTDTGAPSSIVEPGSTASSVCTEVAQVDRLCVDI
ncbi:Rib43a protein, partial [Kipferlia bialata]|eukprot:g4549.t1